MFSTELFSQLHQIPNYNNEVQKADLCVTQQSSARKTLVGMSLQS